MAIIKFGPTVVGARGTIAGTIFSANKAGPFIRGWSRGSNPRSTLQSLQRGRLGTLASSWRDLTQVQRDDWIDYADDPAQELTNSLGETFFASGFNWYLKINLALEATGAPDRDDAPTLTRPVAPVLAGSSQQRYFTTGSTTESSVRIEVASPGLAELHVVKCRIASQGVSALTEGFSSIIIAVPSGLRRIVIQDELEAVFGTILADTRLFIDISVQDTEGQRGPSDTEKVDVQTD